MSFSDSELEIVMSKAARRLRIEPATDLHRYVSGTLAHRRADVMREMNGLEYRDLQARIDADIERVQKQYAREREKRAASKKPRKQLLREYIEQESHVRPVPKADA